MPKVSEAHREAVRRRLLDAARSSLVSSGYEGSTTREILAEAGLSAGTLYSYFPSKEDLYAALAEEVIADDLAGLVAGAEAGEGVGSVLVRILGESVLAHPTPGAVALAQFRGRTSGHPEVTDAIAKVNRDVVDAFRPMVEQAKADGFLRDDVDVDALIELLDVVWDGLSRRAGQGSFQTSYERLGAACMQILLKGALR